MKHVTSYPSVSLPVEKVELLETISVSEQVSDAGVMLQKHLFKKQLVKDKFKDLKVSDFTMENLISVGAVSDLSQTSLISSDKFSTSEKLEKLNSQFDEQFSKE